MKNTIVVLSLGLLSSLAFAQTRAVTAQGGGVPMGHARTSACQDAKSKAARKARDSEEVVEYSECDCSKGADKDYPWSCSVDARLAKKKE